MSAIERFHCSLNFKKVLMVKVAVDPTFIIRRRNNRSEAQHADSLRVNQVIIPMVCISALSNQHTGVEG